MSSHPRSLASPQRHGQRELVPQLGGTGLLADDVYLLAHNDVNGRPCLQPRALGLGLAGGLLAELMLAGSIRIRCDRVAAAAGTGGGGGVLAARVLGLMVSEGDRLGAREWLLFLARTAASDVAQRLAGAGYVAPARRRGWRAGRWVPVDSDCAFAPLVRVRPALVPRSRDLTTYCACLAGLAGACGLGPRIFAYAPDSASRACLEQAVARLDPGPRYLIAQTRAAVDSAVLSQRV